MPKMSETELVGLVNSRIADCRQFDRSALTNQREWAIRFYDGEVDIAPQPNRSQVVSQDLADVLEWVLPGLLRVFTAPERIVIYEPQKIADEQYADQATDGINYIFLNECAGYSVLYSLFHNALLHGNGPYKIWWEGSPEYRSDTLRGLNEIEFHSIISQPDVEEVQELSTYLVDPTTGQEIETPDEQRTEMRNAPADTY